MLVPNCWTINREYRRRRKVLICACCCYCLHRNNHESSILSLCYKSFIICFVFSVALCTQQLSKSLLLCILVFWLNNLDILDVRRPAEGSLISDWIHYTNPAFYWLLMGAILRRKWKLAVYVVDSRAPGKKYTRVDVVSNSLIIHTTKRSKMCICSQNPAPLRNYILSLSK